MRLKKTQITLDGGLNYDFPPLVKLEQRFPREREGSIKLAIQRETQKISGEDLSGKKIAITAGSRGIVGIVEILNHLGSQLKALGAKPFVVPAMGSHGGATAAGQVDVLESYGITEDSIGMPIRSSMDSVEVGQLEDGTSLYCDRLACEADGIVLCNKIKPHADFKGDYESGLIKMLAIGLGKHKGATVMHRQGFERFDQILPIAGKLLLEKLPIVFGVAILENAYHDLMAIEIIRPENILSREKDLLVAAKQNIARLLLPEIDLLIIDEIGKNISGEGMDPNVTGRPGSGLLAGFDAPKIQKIVVLDITEESHGNGVGIGMADITTLQCVNKIDFNAMYTNAATATILDPAKIPLIMNNDRDALALALRLCNRVTYQTARVVRIKNTLELDYVWVSEACLPSIESCKDLSVFGERQALCFDSLGHLTN